MKCGGPKTILCELYAYNFSLFFFLSFSFSFPKLEKCGGRKQRQNMLERFYRYAPLWLYTFSDESNQLLFTFDSCNIDGMPNAILETFRSVVQVFVECV